MSYNTRLYVGNLTYVAQKIDVRALFADHGNEVKHIDISTDPFAGRHGTYCFVDFHSADDSSEAMEIVQSQNIRGRPVNLRPYIRREGKGSEFDRGHVFDRWSAAEDTPSRWRSPQVEASRVYVGGLPRRWPQKAVNMLMRELVRGRNIAAVGRLI